MTERAHEYERNGQVGLQNELKRDDIAIVGMSCLFPGAPNVDAYWRNILNKVDSVTDPPVEAWDPAVYYDPDAPDTDRVYCKRGGYLGSMATFDPLLHGIPPIAVGGEPDQWLALQLAQDAMDDAGFSHLPEHIRQRTSVILGKGTYLNGGNALVVQHSLMLGQTLALLKSLHPEFTDAELALLRHEMKKSLPAMGPETMPGLIPNIIVGRIANRLDLMGPSYTVDAACASSLIAVHRAMRDLQSGECDLALVGGSQVWIPVATLNVFCQLGALSRNEQIRPFDEAADGTLLGEGIGMVVLKRVSDAERDGDRIYAVIKGVGVASDGRGVSVMAPRVEGEELALRRAYSAAGVSPQTVGLIEAHGTGTPVGDVVEMQALTRVFGERTGNLPTCAVGSVKSMISHTMPAAGVAGLIKTALALYHKTLPPTLHCEKPNPKLELEKGPFYLNTETRPWIHGGAEPRRAGVNAFGFGGINAHVVLEEYTGDGKGDSKQREQAAASRPLAHLPAWDSEVCVLEGESRHDLIERVGRIRQVIDAIPAHANSDAVTAGSADRITLANLAFTLNSDLRASDSSCRLAVVATSLDDLGEKLAKASKRLADPRCRQIKDVSGIYFAAEPLGRQGKVAFLFPGEGAQYPNMLADLCLHFPEVRACFDRTDRLLHGHPRGYLPSDYLFPRPTFAGGEPGWAEQHLTHMDGAIEAVLTANQAMIAVLQGLRIQPDVIVGHSTGEYSALAAAGILDFDNEKRLADFMLALNQNYEDTSKERVPRAVLLAIGAEREHAEAIAREAGGEIYVAMDNCPHQAVLVGENDAAERALEIVRREGLIYERLTFDRAYHTRLFGAYAESLRRIFETLTVQPPRVRAYSCTTAAPYPTDPGELRDLMMDHWVRPVEFRRTIETLHADDVRLFVEVGPRGNLSAFVEDILRGRDFAAVPANVQRRSGMTQVNHMVGILAAHGLNFDFTYLYHHRTRNRVLLQESAIAAPVARPSARVDLATTFPMMRLPKEVARRFHRDRTTSPEPGRATTFTSTPSVDATAPSKRFKDGGQSQSPPVIAESHLGPATHTPAHVPETPANIALAAPRQITVSSGLAGESTDPRPQSRSLGHGYSLADGQVPESGNPPPSDTTASGQFGGRQGDLAPSGGRSNMLDVMHGYWQSMDEFLQTQEQVIQAYLLPVEAGAPNEAVAPGHESFMAPQGSLSVAGQLGASGPNGNEGPSIAPTDLWTPLSLSGNETAWDEPMPMRGPASDNSAVATSGPSYGDRMLELPDAQPSSSPTMVTMRPDRWHESDGAVETPSSIDRDKRTLITSRLLALVSDRTGYPSEMLDLSLDLEADLGIDSIKRVEILGSYRQQFSDVADLEIEQLTTLRTLHQIIEVLAPAMSATPPAAPSPVTTPTDRGDPATSSVSPYPLLGRVVSWTPEVELITQRVFDVAEDLYLRDHTLGRNVSNADPDLLALAVMPLTMSLEILAESAAALVPGRRVIGLREVRAYRWLAWDEEPQTLQVVSRRVPGTEGDVTVQLRNLTEDGQSDHPAKSPVIEATVILAEAYPSAPDPRTSSLSDLRPSQWRSDRLYTDVMFHGPAWQGVVSIDQTGERGSTATLRVLPFDRFFRSDVSMPFVLDPVTLDAAGQVIGFWTTEQLASASVIFPFRLESLTVFGPPRPVYEKLQCHATIELVGERQVRSDLDVLDANGRVWMRLDGWWDKRFELTREFQALITSSGSSVSTIWREPIAQCVNRQPLQCRSVLARFASDAGFWKRVWTQRILSRTERKQFAALRTPEPRQLEWLGGRAAAKEAVQQLLKDHAGLEVALADIELRPDEHGRPVVYGAWRASLNAVPVVSLAHSDGLAVAIAGLAEWPNATAGSRPLRVGIDIEKMRQLPDGFAQTALTEAERNALESVADCAPNELLLRAWCAKEAVAKALGDGLVEGPRSIAVVAADQTAEHIAVQLTGALALAHPDLAGSRLLVYTGREDTLMVATTLCEVDQSLNSPVLEGQLR